MSSEPDLMARIHKQKYAGLTPTADDRVCPSCGGRNYKIKSPRGVSMREHPENHFCRSCSTHFERPVPRREYEGGSDVA